ncbi:MAG TPA: glycosyl transferase family protein [Bryobacteraceae bacterium]|nr:glycosyl transferase family protein [Bryobacteraceae bacterium]
MASAFASVWSAFDTFVAACLLPAALAILASGLDDLVLNAICLWAWLLRRGFRAGGSQRIQLAENEKAIAIFVPLWNEFSVISGMVEHNVAAIDYDNYHFFIGAYPNDEPTLDAVRDLETRFPHVHLAVCPHDGPTSKADCLNWIYQRMLLFEEHNGFQFDIAVTHDAEDLIHPGAFEQINSYADRFEMIQIPVLPLSMPFRKFVHGIYCDEFAEWQMKDMPARQLMGSFVPSNGVGTGFTRRALEKLATAEHNLIFEPACLTEDYENGLRLHKLGCPQVFVPLSRASGDIIATREFFPHTVRSAIRQRTRWMMGIGLQSWERHGWRGTFAEVYWFWRDRKGLFGNPVSLFTNFLFVYGLLSWLAARVAGLPWGVAQHALHTNFLLITLIMQIVQTSIRMVCTGRLYGILFALGVPLRALCANWINTIATLRAISGYLRARIRHEPLVWLKTEHAYPSRNALMEHKRKLGEILVGSAYLDQNDLSNALAVQPAGLRIGEFLVKLGKISHDDLYEALSLQQSLPVGRLDPLDITTKVARALPRHLVRDWRVLPFRIAAGSMFLASPDIPTDELSRIVSGFTRLALRFHLVTPSNFQELADSLL